MLDIFNRSTTPAERQRPILDVPELLPPPQEQPEDDEPQEADMDGGGVWTSPRTRKNKRRRLNKKDKKEPAEDRMRVPDVMKDPEGRVNAAETMIVEAGVLEDAFQSHPLQDPRCSLSRSPRQDLHPDFKPP